MKKAFFSLFLLVPLAALFSFSGIQDQIVSAIKSGNAKALSEHFASNIDMTIEDEEGVYSKAQAMLILKNFFEQHKPTEFKIIHNGTSKSGLEYAIGQLTTSGGQQFRVPFFIKEENGRKFIQQISFDPS